MTASKRRRLSAIERDHVRMRAGVAEPAVKEPEIVKMKRAAAEAAIMAVLSRLTPEEEKY